MRLPTIQGIIKRRLLINYRVDPSVMAKLLPAPFQPKLHDGYAIAGICLIRLEEMRPIGLPAFAGFSSENAAHRIAVEWIDPAGDKQEGVYIPRRDTGSWMNHLAGGRLFPGEAGYAAFKVTDAAGQVDLTMRSNDGEISLHVSGRDAGERMPKDSRFRSLAESSAFFEGGCLGYSATCEGSRLDGLVLRTKVWSVKSFEVSEVKSSYFDDLQRFPAGSVEFDHALVMRDIEHRWDAVDSISTPISTLPPILIAPASS